MMNTGVVSNTYISNKSQEKKEIKIDPEKINKLISYYKENIKKYLEFYKKNKISIFPCFSLKKALERGNLKLLKRPTCEWRDFNLDSYDF